MDRMMEMMALVGLLASAAKNTERLPGKGACEYIGFAVISCPTTGTFTFKSKSDGFA